MPMDVSWYRENRIILVTVSQAERINSLADDAESIKALIEASPEPMIHVLMDLTEAGGRSPNARGVAGDIASAFRHPRVGWIVAYGNNSPFIKFIAGLVSQILGVRSRIVRTQEEAVTFLDAYDMSLHVDQENDTAVSK